MIISASRRTDIPAFYSEWFFGRVRAGSVSTRNPFNRAQVRELSLRPEDVDCIVFWTKNPAPMLPRLTELDERGLSYYFQFTLTPYGAALERNVGDKAELLRVFNALSHKLGPRRVRWRYDPIILNSELDASWHRRAFAAMCERLEGSTEGVTISFVDLYARVKTPLVREITAAEMAELACSFSEIAARHGLGIDACCEALDLSPYGIRRASCIDAALVSRIAGSPVTAPPDRNQREGCGCAASVDIGVYNTCANGCVYCYASHSGASVAANRARHNPAGEFLLG